eukprot:1298060-Pleurochrysis_carterae.AAC.1
MQIYLIFHQHRYDIFLNVHLHLEALRVCSRTRPADAFWLLPALAYAADDFVERTGSIRVVTSMRRKFAI